MSLQPHNEYMFTSRFILVIFLSFYIFTLFGQNTKAVYAPARVFVIGEEEKRYESILQQYSLMLFQVCDNSMDEAYDHWNNMLRDMEGFAKTQNSPFYSCCSRPVTRFLCFTKKSSASGVTCGGAGGD